MENKFINIVKNILLVATILSIVPLVMSFVYLGSSIDMYETIKSNTMIVSAIGTVITCFISAFVTLALFIIIKMFIMIPFIELKNKLIVIVN